MNDEARAARTIDVSTLPTMAFGHRSLMWWGTVGMFAIEGTVFVLLIVSYIYLRTRTGEWPPGRIPPPELFWGTVNTALFLISAIPNQLAKHTAEKLNLRAARFWGVVTVAVAIAACIVRIFEFHSLNVWWDRNAYGSIVWTLLGTHTVHLLTDIGDTVVLMALLFVGPADKSRLVDVSENSLYWHFVVATWIPIYAVLYLAPRF